MDIYQESLKEHEKKKGKLEIKSKFPLKDKHDLSIAYTPGVAKACEEIFKDKNNVYKYTIKSNSVAVISDGSAVLGLGNIGAEAALPVMEGKCILMKEFANLDAFPICLKTQETESIISTIKNIAPVFGAINLEDIAAPKCFEVNAALQDIGIPVMHDDQQGTAVVLLAAMQNAAKVTKKNFSDLKVVINGAGAAGIAVANLFLCHHIDSSLCIPIKDIILCDSKGIIHKKRTDLNSHKKELLPYINKENKIGSIHDALVGADVFIGLSVGKLLKPQDIKKMSKDAIIFAMANPEPEIMPDEAKQAGAAIIGTGRSDFANQINNVLGFPGIFRGALDAKATKINTDMLMHASLALASCVKNPSKENILPNPLEKETVRIVAEAVKKAAIESGVIRK